MLMDNIYYVLNIVLILNFERKRIGVFKILGMLHVDKLYLSFNSIFHIM